MEPSVSFTYSDVTTHSLTALGATHQLLCMTPPVLPAQGMLLHTCHRVEWYTTGDELTPISLLQGRPTIAGSFQALVRLAQIAAGTRSLIVGERFIEDQVRGAASCLPRAHPLLRLTAEALRLAERARHLFDVHASLDYSDLAHLLLTYGEVGASRQLVVIGGGMLARAVASTPPPGCRRIIMVTRNPRKLRRLVERFAEATVVRANNLPDAVGGQPYDAIIATTNLNSDYHPKVVEAVCSPLARRLVDLCCVPTLTVRPPGYRHLYDPDVLRGISAANREISERAALARSWITQHAEALV